MPFYMDIAEPARNRAAKKLQPETEAEADEFGTTLSRQLTPGETDPFGMTAQQPLPLATPASAYNLGPATDDIVRPARPQPLPVHGLSPELEQFGLKDIYSTALDVEAADRPQQAATAAETDILGATLPEPTPTWDPRGREKGMEAAAQEAAAGGYEGQTIDLTREMMTEPLLAALAERGVKVNPVPTFDSEGAGRRALMALGVAADVGGALFEFIAETGWESVKFALGTGDVPTVFKEGFVATVEQHRKRSIASQIGLGIVFDPFVLAKVFGIPAKASGVALRSTLKSQLVDLAENNASALAGREIDDVVEEIAIQYERKNLSPTEYQAATRDQNVFQNLDDPDLSFGADELAAANRDPNMVYRYDPDLPPEEARAAVPSPLDDFGEQHLQNWLNRVVPEDQRDAVEAGMKRMLQEHPDLIERGRTYPEIRQLAERNEFIPPYVPEAAAPPPAAAAPSPAAVPTPGVGAPEPDILTRLGQAFRQGDINSAERARFLEEDIRPVFRERFGDAPAMTFDRVKGENLLRISEGGWENRARELGLEPVYRTQPTGQRVVEGYRIAPTEAALAPSPAAVAGPPPAGTVPIPEEAIPTPRPVAAVPERAVVPEQVVPEGQVIPEQVIPEEAVPTPTPRTPETRVYTGTAAREVAEEAAETAAARVDEMWATIGRQAGDIVEEVTPAVAREAPLVKPSTQALRTPGVPPTPMARIANFVDEPNYQFASDNVIQHMSTRDGGRDMVVVDVPNHGPQAFYRSTGNNSGKPGEWLPFDGISPRRGGWFDKYRFTFDRQGHALSEEMDRYGTPELKAMSERLTSMNIPEGQVIADQRDINAWLNTPETLRQNSDADALVARGGPQDTPPPPRGTSPEDITPPPAEGPAVPAAADVPPNGPQTPPPGRATGDEPPLRFNDDGSVDVMPPIVRNIINLQPIQVGLASSDKVRNLAAQLLGKIVRIPQADAIAAGVRLERERVRQNIDSLAVILAERTKAVFTRQRDGSQIFIFDDQGRIPALAGIDPNVPGAPTIQDVAARLPNYADSLTPEQMGALRRLEGELRPWREMLDELEIDISTRMDVMMNPELGPYVPYSEPGFYIPRGRTALEGADEPIQMISTRPRGRAGFERGATFDSMAQGIDEGYEYAQIFEVVQGYAQEAGGRALNKHVANFMMSAREEGGALIGVTPKMRLLKQNPDLVVLKASLDNNLNRLKGLLGRVTERQQRIIDDFIDGDEFDDIDALRVVLEDVRAAGGPNVGASIREIQELLRNVRQEVKELAPTWKRALEKARQAGRDERAIDLAELNNRTFPVALADAVNATLRKEKATPWSQLPILRHVAALNNLYRGFNATGDNSALGIQGLLGLANDPQAYAAALGTNIRAWGRGGDQVLGQFLLAFDDKAVKSGRMNSVAWGQETLHLGGQNTEYLIGRGGTSFLNSLPGIRQANRAFGYFGDALRLQWADDELERLLRTTGRSLEELRSNGDIKRIADAVNGATGYSPNKAFGDMGDLLFFAPRFLQARMETVGRGLMGMRPGATVEQRFARRSLLKLIGGGVMLTYAANMMMGNETEVKPWKDGRYNSNFMRIRFGDRDISVFGSWELIPRAIIATASGNPQQVVRGLGSGVVSSTWDLLWNKDFMGKAVYGEEGNMAEWLLGHVTPFAADELLPTTRNLVKGVQGDPRSLVAGITSAFAETTGIKSSPLSGSEATAMAREAQAQQMGNSLASYRTNRLGELVDDRPIWEKLGEDPVGALRGGIQTGDASQSPIYDQLSAWDKEKIDKTPAVAKAKVEWEKQQRERQSEYRAYKDDDDELVAEFVTKIKQLDGPSKEARDAITLHQRELANDRQDLRERSSEALQWLEEKEPAKGIENEAFADYAKQIFDDTLTDPITFVYDFKERDQRMADLRAQYGDEVIGQIQEFIHRNDPPLIKELRDDRELLREYWELEDDYLVNMPQQVKDRIEFYRESSKSGRPELPGQWADVSPHITAIENIRRGYRTINRDVDEALAKWGYRAVPGNMDIRIKYAETRFLPAIPGGSLQPQAQPTAQPQAQPGAAAPSSIWQSVIGGGSPQPTMQPTAPATPAPSIWQSVIGAGAR